MPLKNRLQLSNKKTPKYKNIKLINAYQYNELTTKRIHKKIFYFKYC